MIHKRSQSLGRTTLHRDNIDSQREFAGKAELQEKSRVYWRQPIARLKAAVFTEGKKAVSEK